MIKPVILDVEVTTACQLKCKGCPVNTNTRIGHMDLDYYKYLVDMTKKEMPDITVCLFMDGEVLLHPHYFEMLKYTIDAGLRVYFTTNGMIWNEEIFQLITEKNSCYQIIFSLDGLPGPFSKSIEIARPGSNREKILDTIYRFGKLKESKGNNLDMAVKICERGQDYEEIENYIYHWLKKSYIDYVCVGKLLDKENSESMRIYPCQYSDNRFIVIKWDGMVIPCAYNCEYNNDRKLSFGYLQKGESILDFYNNEAMTKFRNDQRNGVFTDVCSKCGYAFTGNGFQGTLEFRDKKKSDLNKVFYRNDYYNSFYSLVCSRNGAGDRIVE